MKGEEKTSYYYLNGKKQVLEKEPRIFAVKLNPGRFPRDISGSNENIFFLNEESEQIDFIPEYGLQVYYTEKNKARSGRSKSQENVVEAVRKLSREEAVDYATVAYKRNPQVKNDGEIPEVMFTSNQFLVKFKENTTLEQIHDLIDKHNVEIVELLGYTEKGYLLQTSEVEGEKGPIALANDFYESGLVEWAHPNFIQQRHIRYEDAEVAEEPAVAQKEKRVEPEEERFVRDIYLPQQWHLPTAKVTDAWKVTKGSSAIRIAIIDDGVDTKHDEFTGQIIAQYDFATNSEDASPKTAGDKHGTACAGVALARGKKCFGSAPECRMIAIRMAGFYDFATQAKMFQWAADEKSDIISCSWGPPDGIGSYDPLPDNIRAAIDYCAEKGRGGKGIPVFFAAGNGNESISDDGWASYKNVIAVAASTSNETRSWYSDTGPEVDICAPSSGSSSKGEKSIFTTDRRGSAGYNAGGTGNNPANADYTSTFGGTSSSTPLAAGVAGLMLSVNPALTRNQVLQILKDTADKIDQEGGNYTNGHSHKYGYGRINGEKAVKKANEMKSMGGGSTGGETLKPSISGPSQLSKDAVAPAFNINKGGRRFFAVEVATRSNLFDLNNHQNDRNQNNFYGSWSVRLETGDSYTLPTEVWNRLKNGDKLFYRLHVADNNQWDNHGVTVADSKAAEAPFISIGAAEAPATPGGDTSKPSIRGPQSHSRTASPPRFEVNRAGRKLFAVEVATKRELFNIDSHGDQRNESNFYGSWQDTALFSSSFYDLPERVWNKLKQADLLYYRAHFADDNQWANHLVTVSDQNFNSAPSINIIASGSQPSSGTGRMVTYPSGNRFKIEESPTGNINYSDHVANGAVPLIEIRGRYDEKLSRNFIVREFASGDNAPYARISVQLVEKLQLLRDKLARPIIINSAYRHNAYNEAVGGAANSQHVAGRAVDIHVRGMTPLNLAKNAIEVFGCNIGIGLGRNNIHLDLRGTLTSWVYEGAAMNKQEFGNWVQEQCAQVGRFISRTVPVIKPELKLSVTGPESYFVHNNIAPSFRVTTPHSHPYYAIEIAEAPFLMLPENAEKRDDGNFFASWVTQGLQRSQGFTVYYMDTEVWNRFRGKEKLFYRVLASQEKEDWVTPIATTTNRNINEAPWISLKDHFETIKNVGKKPELQSLVHGISKIKKEPWLQ
jgi:subtilisin family serine protease/uncharacterized protein YcbK (DUF882 family)